MHNITCFYHCIINQTDGATSTGCYDLRCAGYVPASGASLLPGQAVAPPSEYGKEGRQVTLSLNKVPPRTRQFYV
jgi:hypothetical protein